MMTRNQRGFLYQLHGGWHVRWWEKERGADGTVVRRYRSKKLASVRDYPRKSEVRALAEEFMAKLNSSAGTTTDVTMSVARFVEEFFLPQARENLRQSAARGYRSIWRTHVRGFVTVNKPLREFQTYDAETMLKAIAGRTQLAKNSLLRMKSFLSGVFREAIRLGFLNGANPIREVRVPAGSPQRKMPVYSLGEVRQLLAILPEPARTVVATAAFSGLREGELRGLNWDDYSGQSLNVQRSLWGKTENLPKGKSAGLVPVIPVLARMLDRHRARTLGPVKGPIFSGPRGVPLNLDNLARRVIRPVLKLRGIEWKGWHAFRRGLATTLHDLGVDDLTIQAILRHSDVGVTRKSYIQTLPTHVVAAMEQVDQQFAQYEVVN